LQANDQKPGLVDRDRQRQQACPVRRGGSSDKQATWYYYYYYELNRKTVAVYLFLVFEASECAYIYTTDGNR
jgi:hypothetical protein